jgi:hypothetical protein
MISRHYTLQRRCSRQLCTKYATRQLASSSFSGGLGSRLLKTAEKDPTLNPADNNQLPKSPTTDPPKRVSIFSRPASSIPAQNGGMQNVGPYGNLSSLNKTATDPAKPRFSLNLGIQNNGLRRPAGSLWKPIPGTATNLGAVAAVAAAAAPAVNKPTGLEGQSSIRDFARQVNIQEKIDAVTPRDTVIVTGAKGVFTQQEVEDMKNDYDPNATPISTAGQIRADVLGMDLTEDDSDEDDDQPREELTTGEIRYWKYQVLFGAACLASRVACR